MARRPLDICNIYRLTHLVLSGASIRRKCHESVMSIVMDSSLKRSEIQFLSKLQHATEIYVYTSEAENKT
jgi:hypothetical protein